MKKLLNIDPVIGAGAALVILWGICMLLAHLHLIGHCYP